MESALIIRGGIKIASTILAYFGFIDTVHSDLKKLLHSDFKSAIQNLQFALSATGDNQIIYIKQALIEFNKASSIEENENKISCYLGLCMCQKLLGDDNNAALSLSKIADVQLSNSAIFMSAVADAVTDANPLGKIVHKTCPDTYLTYRREKAFNDYKQLAMSTTLA